MINDMNHLLFKSRRVNKCLAKPHLLAAVVVLCISRGEQFPSQSWTKIRSTCKMLMKTFTAAFQKQVTQIALGKLCKS